MSKGIFLAAGTPSALAGAVAAQAPRAINPSLAAKPLQPSPAPPRAKLHSLEFGRLTQPQ